MAKFIKFFTYSFVIFFVVWAFLAFVLTQFGLETKRFNPLIVEQVKKYNEDLNLEIKKVKVYLSIGNLTNPKLRISTKDIALTLDNNKMALKSVDAKIDILSYFKDKFVIEELEFKTKDNKIKNLISFAALKKPSLIIYNIFIKKGYANAHIFLKFNKKGKVTNYKLTGEVKNAELKYDKKYYFKDINFDFTNNREGTSINNAKLDFKKIKFLSNEIIIQNLKEKMITGDIRNEKTKINLNDFKSLFKNDLNYIKNQEITFEAKNEFSFILQKGKIKKLKYLSQIDLDNVSLNLEKNLLKKLF